MSVFFSEINDWIDKNETLQSDATGTVKDFKVTDGKGIGVVVELSNGTTTWFFDDEITAA